MSEERTIGPYQLTASRVKSATGHEYEATDTDLGVKVLLTLVDVLNTIDAESTRPERSIAHEYQRVMTRMLALENPLLGMPKRVSPTTSEHYWYTSHATDGTSLRRHLEHRGPLHWRLVALILLEASKPLNLAHQRDIAHANIGATSVLIEPNGALRFTRPDVAARVLLKREQGGTLSLEQLWDEPLYLSPEVLNRRLPGPADDIYALGILAYELLTGRLPYTSTSEPLGRAQSRRSAPDPGELVSGIPEAMSRLVRSMAAPRVAIRLRDAGALRARIEADLLDEVSPNEVRSQLVAALRSRVQRAVPDTRAEVSALPRETGSRAQAERTIDQALLAAGMSPGTQRASARPVKRGLWVGVGLVVAIIAALALTTGDTLRLGGEQSAPTRTPPKASAESRAEVAPTARPEAQAPAVVVDPVEVARLKAEALAGSGSLKLAERVLKHALAEGIDEAGTLRIVLASILAKQGRIDAAVAAYLESDGADMTRSEGHVKAGVLVATDGRCSDAIALFEEAERRTGTSPQILKHLGNCHLIEGQVESALDALNKAYVAVKDDLDIVVPLAQTLEKQGEVKRSLELYRRALSLAPDDRRAREGLTRIQGRAGVALSGMALPGDVSADGDKTDDAGALEQSAHAAFQRGEFSRAAGLYAKALEALGGKRSPRLLKNHALALHKAERLRPAIRAYEKALEASADDAELRFLMGMALQSQGQFAGASRAFAAVLEREPGHLKARFELGLVALKRGRYDEAARAFEESLKRNPGNKSALQNLVKARLEGGDQKGALEALGQMHAQHPADVQTLLSMAALLQTMDRDDEAQALLDDACAKGIQRACP